MLFSNEDAIRGNPLIRADPRCPPVLSSRIGALIGVPMIGDKKAGHRNHGSRP